MAQLRDVLVVNDRVRDADLAARLRLGLQQVALGANRRTHRGDELLADRVERRVRHLREELLEVVVEQARLVREHRERRVRAHRADRLFAVDRHRPNQHAQVFLRVAEGLLALQDRVVIRLLRARGRQIVDVDEIAVQPLAIGMLRRQVAFDLLIVDDAALRRVDEEDAAGMQALLDEHVLVRDSEHADFRRHDDEVVLRHVVARRTQTVAIEHRADHRAVGERDRRGAVPRLHQRRVVLVERLAVGIHHVVPAPRLGNHHEDRVRQRPSGHRQELEHVVEGRRVAAAFADHRQDFAQVVAEQLALHLPLARAHPVDVAAQRIDLAVVRDVAIRVRERPRGERVRAEPLMHERESGFERRVREIREHRRELPGREHPLVGERVARQADDVEEAARERVDGDAVDGVLDALADHIELPFEALSIREGRADEDLLEHRLRCLRAVADETVVGRHVAPAEQRAALLVDNLRDQIADRFAIALVARQEHESSTVGPCLGQRERKDLAEKLVRRLDQNAGAIARVGLAAARAAVLEVDEDLHRLAHNPVRLASLDVDDEADTAGIAFIPGVIETLRRRREVVRAGHGRHILTSPST